MKVSQRRYEATSIKSKIAPYEFYLREQGIERFKGKSQEWAEAGLCPFHDDNSTGSFWIHLENGAYKCFSCGAKGGDIVTFTMNKYGQTFYEALIHLVNEWGVC